MVIRDIVQEDKPSRKRANRIYISCLCLLWSCSTILPANAIDLPHEFSAYYKLTKGIITLGKSQRSFKKIADNEYLFESISKPYGVGKIMSNGEIHERSVWTLHENKLRPIRYSYLNSDSDLKRDVKLDFDWQKKIVINNINGDPWKMKLEPATQDKLLYFLSLMVDLKQGNHKLVYKVADGGTTKTYRSIVEGEQNILTELGKFTTLKVVRRHHDGKRTTLWCAISLDYLPIRIEQTKKDGSSVRASIYKLEGIPIKGRIMTEKQ